MGTGACVVRSERLRQYLDAERAILSGAQSYTLEGRSLTRANLSEIRKAIEEMLADGVTPDGVMKKQRTLRAVFID